MEYINTRQKEILYLLLSEPDDYLVVQDFADRVQCSEKTIRNDLKVIEIISMSILMHSLFENHSWAFIYI